MQGYWYPMYSQYPYYGQMAQSYPQQPAGSQIGPQGAPTTPTLAPNQGELPIEQSYIENILRLNRGKVATIYMTFENNEKWNAKIFKGVVEAAGRDHVILKDPETERRYVLLMVYVDYITFDDVLEYDYPFTEYTPR